MSAHWLCIELNTEETHVGDFTADNEWMTVTVSDNQDRAVNVRFEWSFGEPTKVTVNNEQACMLQGVMGDVHLIGVVCTAIYQAFRSDHYELYPDVFWDDEKECNKSLLVYA